MSSHGGRRSGSGRKKIFNSKATKLQTESLNLRHLAFTPLKTIITTGLAKDEDH